MEVLIVAGAALAFMIFEAEKDGKKERKADPATGDGDDPGAKNGPNAGNSPANGGSSQQPPSSPPSNGPPVGPPDSPPPPPRYCAVPIFSRSQMPGPLYWQWAVGPMSAFGNSCKASAVPVDDPLLGGKLLPVWTGTYNSSTKTFNGEFYDPDNVCGKFNLICDPSAFPGQ